MRAALVAFTLAGDPGRRRADRADDHARADAGAGELAVG